jgi:hypothetical protein
MEELKLMRRVENNEAGYAESVFLVVEHAQ